MDTCRLDIFTINKINKIARNSILNYNCYKLAVPATLELVIIGRETTTIPVPLQTYFIRNCSRTTYHNLWVNTAFMCWTRDLYAFCKWIFSTCKNENDEKLCHKDNSNCCSRLKCITHRHEIYSY